MILGFLRLLLEVAVGVVQLDVLLLQFVQLSQQLKVFPLGVRDLFRLALQCLFNHLALFVDERPALVVQNFLQHANLLGELRYFLAQIFVFESESLVLRAQNADFFEGLLGWTTRIDAKLFLLLEDYLSQTLDQLVTLLMVARGCN